MKVIIDPISNIYYSAFYVKGLCDIFGKSHVYFKSYPFNGLAERGANFNFIIIFKDKEKKYSIHFDDPYKIKKSQYEWCDVYASVNANFKNTPIEFQTKLISLVPSFGIKIWNLPESIFYGGLNYLKSPKNTGFKKFFGKYKRQWQLRQPIEQYYVENALIKHEELYIFHLSTLWYNDEWNKNDEGVNKTRANFIKACKSIDSIKFEGGLSTTDSITVNPNFIDLIYTGVISMSEYLDKVKKSILVFNTPAFWDCHGWKLGEYLAMGKAIISTPLSNDLPEPLIHGVNIHFVENTEAAITEAVIKIVGDRAYRLKLEKGAKDYWEKYGTPIKSLELMGIK